MNRDHPRTVLLLISTCCHEALVRPFLNVAKLIESEGVRVVALLTDGNCCSFFSKLKAPAEQRCEGFRASTLETLRDAGLCVVPLSTIPYDSTADPRMSHLVQIEPSTLVTQYASHPLWKTIKTTVTRHCDWDRVPDGTARLNWKDAATIEQFLSAATRYQWIFHHLFTKYCPSHVLLFNGVFYEERIACDIAASLGIDVVLNESCCFGDRWIFRRFDRKAGIRGSLRLQVPKQHFQLPSKKKATLDSYLREVYAGHNNRIYQPEPGFASETLQKLTVCGKRIALFLGQVPYDTVITEDEMVSSVEEAVLEAIQVFERHDDWHLVIRLHPGARQTASHHDRLSETLSKHPSVEKFTVVKGYEVSTYDLMRIAEMGVTISSQAGMELLGQHKPVVVLGEAFYRGNGVTIDRKPDESIRSAIERGIYFDADDSFNERVDAVLHYWIFEHLTPILRGDGSLPVSSAKRILGLFDCVQ